MRCRAALCVRALALCAYISMVLTRPNALLASLVLVLQAGLSFYTLRGLVSKRFALGLAIWLSAAAALILDGLILEPPGRFHRLAEGGLGLGSVALLWLCLFWLRLWGSWGSAAAARPSLAFSVRAVRSVLVLTLVSAAIICLTFLGTTGPEDFRRATSLRGSGTGEGSVAVDPNG